MAERSKRRGRNPQVSQVRSLMEGIGGDGCGADGSTDTALLFTLLTERTCPGGGQVWTFPLCKSDIWAQRSGRTEDGHEVECSHQSCVLWGLWRGQRRGLAERSLRSEDGRTADTAELGGTGI